MLSPAGGHADLRGLTPERFHARAQPNLTAARADIIAGRAVQLGQRHRGNSHASGGGGLQERLAHHLGRIGNRNLVHIFVERADQNCLPEAFDRLLGLAVAFQPVQKRLAPVRRGGGSERNHGAADGAFIGKRQAAGAQECRGRMERSGQGRRADDRGAASRLKKRQVFIPADFVFDPGTAVELDQVGAAAQQHVLAVIHDLAGTRMLVGGRPPAQVRTALEERHPESGLGKGAPGSQTSQPASGDGDCGRLCPGLGHHARRFRNPLPRMASFSGTFRRTRSLKTSYWRAAIFSSRRR